MPASVYMRPVVVTLARMQRSIRVVGACVICLALSAQPALARETITVGTAGVMGVYYPLGGAVCRMINVTRKTHKLRCSVEPSEGSVANIRSVLAKGFDVGI